MLLSAGRRVRGSSALLRPGLVRPLGGPPAAAERAGWQEKAAMREEKVTAKSRPGDRLGTAGPARPAGPASDKGRASK